MKEISEELQKELDILIQEKNDALAVMELEDLRDAAKRYLDKQISALARILKDANEANVKLKKIQLRDWKEKTVEVISDNIHASQGERLREIIKLTFVVGDAYKNFLDEVTLYFEFIKNLHQEVEKRSGRILCLLQDRIRLGHVVQRKIPHLNGEAFKFSQSAVMELLERAGHHLKADRSFPGNSGTEEMSVEARTLDAFLAWRGEADEIIDNLDFAITELGSLKGQCLLSGYEQWVRYRFLIRMYIYEYARFTPAFSRFLKRLWRLNHIDQVTKEGIKECWISLIQSMRETRSQIYHSLMPVIREEEQAFLVARLAPAAMCFVVDAQSGEPIEPSREVGLLAMKMATGLAESARNAVALLQVFTEERYREIMNRFPQWQGSEAEI